MDDDSDTITTEPGPRRPRRRPTGLAAIALIIAIVAIIVAARSVWRLQRLSRSEQAARKQDVATLATLQSRLAAGDAQAQAGSHRLGLLETNLDNVRTTTQGLDRRIANLETAIATLSGQQQSGHDSMLLNDAEMLLRAGQQRYELFHDASGALKAYSQAIAVLAQAQNPAYAPVRVSAATERDALAAAAPPARQTALDTLSSLRAEVASLPLATQATTETARQPAKPGFWSRIGHAFSGIVKVTHDNGDHAPLANAGFARQALALDLAQAQEALLAFDDTTYRNALQNADATLAAQFDSNDANVKAARAHLATMLSQHASGPPPRLGGALAQLESVRASQPAPVPAPPASAASSGGTVP